MTGIGSRIVTAGILALLLGACHSNRPRVDDAGRLAGPPDRRERLVAVAERQLGVPYRYGGSDQRGFDCSGLVYFAHARVGIQVPRTAAAQRRSAQRVPLHRLQAGDLLFFQIDGGKGDHVGIYEGGGRFIHAPSSGKRVSRGDLDNGYWRDRLTAVGSYL